jgi:hypothetical protein
MRWLSAALALIMYSFCLICEAARSHPGLVHRACPDLASSGFAPAARVPAHLHTSEALDPFWRDDRLDSRALRRAHRPAARVPGRVATIPFGQSYSPKE